MKSKSTPGPWHKTPFEDRGWLILHDNLPICHVKHVNEDSKTDEANADLIEAAPTLLKLLQEMVNEYSPFMNIPENYKELKGWPGDENPRMVVVRRSLDLIDKLTNS